LGLRIKRTTTRKAVSPKILGGGASLLRGGEKRRELAGLHAERKATSGIAEDIKFQKGKVKKKFQRGGKRERYTLEWEFGGIWGLKGKGEGKKSSREVGAGVQVRLTARQEKNLHP